MPLVYILVVTSGAVVMTAEMGFKQQNGLWVRNVVCHRLCRVNEVLRDQRFLVQRLGRSGPVGSTAGGSTLAAGNGGGGSGGGAGVFRQPPSVAASLAGTAAHQLARLQRDVAALQVRWGQAYHVCSSCWCIGSWEAKTAFK